ncbi:kinase-like protein [Penicillium crustosum]|uniref:kinase-like protein n=1 Tax=Penicillium crustosum TaxID=36656 RepID=UPI002395EB6E|nr:kinase-like protein [Penicillium crustosum]KAJ5395003.1 kinase-like protein [Penicillium crustosum]
MPLRKGEQPERLAQPSNLQVSESIFTDRFDIALIYGVLVACILARTKTKFPNDWFREETAS